MLSLECSASSSSSENGSDSTEGFRRSELVTVRLMKPTRSDCLSAAMILSSSSGAGGLRFGAPPYFTMIGRAGQQIRAFGTGVPCVQWSRRFRPRGEVNTICRHPRCVHHAHVQVLSRFCHFHPVIGCTIVFCGLIARKSIAPLPHISAYTGVTNARMSNIPVSKRQSKYGEDIQLNGNSEGKLRVHSIN
jgi:hypothetical protein